MGFTSQQCTYMIREGRGIETRQEYLTWKCLETFALMPEWLRGQVKDLMCKYARVGSSPTQCNSPENDLKSFLFFCYSFLFFVTHF